jgi:hypothetical protein
MPRQPQNLTVEVAPPKVTLIESNAVICAATGGFFGLRVIGLPGTRAIAISSEFQRLEKQLTSLRKEDVGHAHKNGGYHLSAAVWT